MSVRRLDEHFEVLARVCQKSGCSRMHTAIGLIVSFGPQYVSSKNRKLLEQVSRLSARELAVLGAEVAAGARNAGNTKVADDIVDNFPPYLWY